MFHFCEYQLHGDVRDKLAWKGLAGCDDERTELLREMSKNRRWITDGENNKMIQKLEDVPDGWYVGRVMDPEVGKKIGRANKGNKQQRTEDWNRKNGEAHSKEFIVIPPDGEPYTFKNKREFCRQQGWPVSREVRIGEVIRGKKKSYKGFVFRRIK